MSTSDLTLDKRAGTAREAAQGSGGARPAADPASEAMRGFVKDFGRTAAVYLESCIHCGMCAEACHFHEVTGDPKYTPVWKLEPFKQAYKREYGPYATFYRMLGLKAPVTIGAMVTNQLK